MNNQRGFSKILIIFLIVAMIAGIIGYFVLTGKYVLVPKIPFLKIRSINVKLIDASSGHIIPNTNVKIHSQKNIWCFRYPCPDEYQEWTGKSDNSGNISIPSKIINEITTITAIGYNHGIDLYENSEKIDKDNWLIELDPDSKIYNNVERRRLKLIDSQTQKPLSNTTLWIIDNQSCRPPQCSDYSFTGITNLLGNAYYPISFERNNVWIFVDNYKITKLPTRRFNHRIILEKE